MATLTIRGLSPEVHRALRIRAASHARSTEAEVRAILEEAVQPNGRLKLGSFLAALGQSVGFTDEEIALLNQRDTAPLKPIDLG
mgnify:CR=1 FL=1